MLFLTLDELFCHYHYFFFYRIILQLNHLNGLFSFSFLFLEPPKFVMKLDSTKLVLNGSLATLECKVTGSPEISIRWYKNETEISLNDKYQMTFIDSVATLQISNCCVEDSGDYICQASSEAGSDRCSCLVTVKGLFKVDHPTFYGC